MGKEWDKFSSMGFLRFTSKWAKEALRILKPGAHLLNFSAPRKYHLMACGVELAGFTIKDIIIYCYGQGITSSLDISQAIDDYYGLERKKGQEKISPDGIPYKKRGLVIGKELTGNKYSGTKINEKLLFNSIPNSEEAQQWNGWGTSLKHALEPIVVAQKPYENTYAENVLKWGVGGMNVNKCRVPYIPEKETDSRIFNPEKNITRGSHEGATVGYAPDGNEYPMYNSPKGRWPSNLILDPIAAKMMDKQSGITRSSKGGYTPAHQNDNRTHQWSKSGDWNTKNYIDNAIWHNDKGGVSRFFYCAKAYKFERNAGCEDLFWEIKGDDFKKITKTQYEQLPKDKRAKGNPIATLKPINLMRYLVRLVTPPGGTVLDPFSGSGTTGIACIIEGFHYILIEKREAFVKYIIPKRLAYWRDPKNWMKLKDHHILPKIENLKNKKQNHTLENWITNSMEVLGGK
jgi:site-specific DNA-methyltransferase (adenine-specific)